MKKPKVVYEVTDLDCHVRLIKVARDNFTVVYGTEHKTNLSYVKAAYEFGAAVLHSAQCAGRLDQ